MTVLDNSTRFFPDMASTLADIASYKQENVLMLVAVQKLQLEVDIISSMFRNADEDGKLQIMSILGILKKNLHNFQMLAKRINELNYENEVLVKSIIDTHYDFLVEHKKYICRMSIEKRQNLAKLTYQHLIR